MCIQCLGIPLFQEEHSKYDDKNESLEDNGRREKADCYRSLLVTIVR